MTMSLLSTLEVTAIGRATIVGLALNRERLIYIRAVDKDMGRHSLISDPIQSERNEG